jgi:hypothetical protein
MDTTEKPIVLSASPGKGPILCYWWASASFLFPFLLWAWHTSFSLLESLISGAIGLAAALLIYFLWSVDQKYHSSDLNKPKFFLWLLGIILWFSFVGLGHIMMIAIEETQSPLDDIKSILERQAG